MGNEFEGDKRRVEGAFEDRGERRHEDREFEERRFEDERRYDDERRFEDREVRNEERFEDREIRDEERLDDDCVMRIWRNACTVTNSSYS